jgi:branched-subunit amino acid aminotransferase/4-amino-4-deoxychorismate lyase
MIQYIQLNGDFFDAEASIFTCRNRGFQFGDAVYEIMRANGTKIHFVQDHLERLISSMQYLNMDIPDVIKSNSIQKDMVKLLHKNKHLKGAQIKITVFRNNGGSYTPCDNACSYLIASKPLETDNYHLNKKGLLVAVFQKMKKPITPFSNLNTSHALIYILAGNFSKAQGLDDCLLMNQHNEIIESIGSNLFLIKKGEIIKTPPLKSGCRVEILRKYMLEYANELGFKISSQQPVAYSDLMEADEVFLTNDTEGILWVAGIEQKRYYHNTAKKLTELLAHHTRIE